MINIKRALISCWDKTGLAEFARQLAAQQVEIISSGGTAAYLAENGIAVTPVEEITGYPEVLNGRVKTLHPLIHAAILAKDTPAHRQDLRKLGMAPIQLVVVNLYPFVEEAVQKGISLEEAVEYIDIGGPTLLRAAAKNFSQVAALYHPRQYSDFLQHWKQQDGRVTPEYSLRRAREIFFYSAWYDGQVQACLARQEGDHPTLPRFRGYFLEKLQDLRYGENPHQPAAVYRAYGHPPRGLAGVEQLWGKPLSYNNYADVQAAYQLVLEFPEPATAIIKHLNPCGAALSEEGLARSFDKALRGDSLSAFGGIAACNRPIDPETAARMAEIFFECIIAPGFEAEALKILQKKKNLRLLRLSPEAFAGEGQELRMVNDTFLLQRTDDLPEDPQTWQVVTTQSPQAAQMQELLFAWKVVKHVKSNAIVLTKEKEIYGVGAGQMSRIDAVKIARMKAEQAGRESQKLALASDAFFPFRDGIDEAVRAGVTAIIQPGGSIRDEEVIAAANEHQISMVFTGVRHFKH